MIFQEVPSSCFNVWIMYAMNGNYEKVTTGGLLFHVTPNASPKVFYSETKGLQEKFLFFYWNKKVMVWQTVFLFLTGWK